MSEMNILNVLKESGTSRVIRSLTPDATIPTISRALEVAEEPENEEERTKLREKVFHTPRIVSNGSHFAFTLPEKRPHYRTLVQSQLGLEELGLQADAKLERLLSGQDVYYDGNKGIFPYSMAYAGFQFGQFAGQLGDGRVVNLFDLKDKKGKYQTLQLKGSGLTPFSRFADGKAVLRSSIREFIISEALHQIGIPSSRALQLTSLPKTRASRGMSFEPTAVVCRVAPSWIRLGNFDLLRWKPNLTALIKLSDFVIDDVFEKGNEFPKEIDVNIFKEDPFADADAERRNIGKVTEVTKYDLLFRHVVRKNAECVAYWQTYGFMNGVLNTDNTSIMGLSIDYGPFNFLDRFEPSFTPNHDDVEGRYAFHNQPSVIWWNLVQFAQSLSILIGAGGKHMNRVLALQEKMQPLPNDVEEEIVERANDLIGLVAHEYKFVFTTKYAELMSRRLGIDLDLSTSASDVAKTSTLVKDFCSTILEPLLAILKTTRIDYNNFFVNLQNYKGPILTDTDSLKGLSRPFIAIFFNIEQQAKLEAYYENEADFAHSDSGETRLLVEALEQLVKWSKLYVDLAPDPQERYVLSKKVNPLFVPRSWIFDQVIAHFVDEQRTELNDPAAKLDTSILQKLLLMSSHPYDPDKWDASLRPDLQKMWSDLSHPETLDHYLKQASCSS
ncbi:hypothetical protein HG536_0D04050 [Torulaspora globosa]|uniref:Selenoprotein O n=1 Tax=Torulaspora globosa TaxID=48254 RepID=A0A7G3ZH97_9SACH|nr:uncharacterized protein HG536_0D04050 [Torulaspora globosa]QLL32883.1 hypothetical protein HG536_0D04050 [Torulaspora globosa]